MLAAAACSKPSPAPEAPAEPSPPLVANSPLPTSPTPTVSPAPSRFAMRWDPATGRGDVVQDLGEAGQLRTCFHCTWPGYSGGLIIGNLNGPGVGLYPDRPIRGYASINVWCAQDESIWDLDERAEYSYGWSENYGDGDDGRVLAYEKGRIIETGPERVVLQSRNVGGCYRVTKVATTRARARFWVIATRIENTCDRPVRFDFFTGEDPWVGRYHSSDGDVGWSAAGLLTHEAEVDPALFDAGGLYDLGNSAQGQSPTQFSNQANFVQVDPATPLPDRVLFANRFAHAPEDIDTGRPLDNKSLTAINLGWTGRRLMPGEGFTVAVAMGLARTGKPGTVPRPAHVTDADWSAWRPWLVEGDGAPSEAVEFAAERVELSLSATTLVVDGHYTVRNRGAASLSLAIRYPILVAEDRPAPSTIEVDGRDLGGGVSEEGTTSFRFQVHVPRRSIRRFRVRYAQRHQGRQAAYMVTSARSWPGPIGRAVFVVRNEPGMGPVRVSLPTRRRVMEDGRVVQTAVIHGFRPDGEVVLRW